ncbi:hypothetical protein WA026_011086 [Henosepilachna vigintioctopunctata]|uniref:Uncharacterized protein n=1 Tax=Henosepilachna vigintioctopunctata TaxID=420089 RepID=A0AAW1U7S6_9CUCU
MKNVREEEIHTNVISSKQPEISSITLNQQYSLFFWGKQKNFPVKCKIKCNDSGERIAEPYIAKKPNPIKLSRVTKDFTMIVDHKCEKLHGKKSTFKPGIEIKPHLTKKKLKSQMAPANALTSYLKKKDECNNIFKGTDGTCDKYLHKKVYHPNAQIMNDCNQVFRGTENLSDKKNVSPTEVANLTPPSKPKRNKAKQIVNNLISKLKSMKLMKSSGFINEDLINEAINRLRVKFLTNNISPHGLTCAIETLASIKMPNCEKSLVRKFGERSKSQQFSTQQTFVEEPPFNKMKGGQPSINSAVIGDQARSNFGTKFMNIMNTNKGSIMKLRKTEDNKALLKRDNVPKSYKDTEPTHGLLMSGGANTKKKNIKLKKHTTYKPKSRKGLRLGKRKRRFSFSKIPIQPNVKGSVIILDETAQPLDDPCKILSVNFFKNDDIACEDVRIEDDGIKEYDTVVGKFTAIKAKSNGFIKNSEVKKIPVKAKIFQDTLKVDNNLKMNKWIMI